MSDLRALMRQRTAEKRIQHPFAKYSTRGELSCSLCHIQIKSEVLWPSHLTSKVHRSNLRREKEEEEAAAAVAARQAQAAASSSSSGAKKRGPGEGEGEGEAKVQKRVRLDVPADSEEEGKEASNDADHEDQPPSSAASFLPAGFFSDPSQAPQASATGGTADEEGEEEDEEWAAFEATLAEPDPAPTASTSYAAATISGEEVMYDDKPDAEEQEQAGDEEEEMGQDEEETGETEEERRDREEREELMERIETEEREQQEADERVDALKKRLQMMRAARAQAGSQRKPSNGHQDDVAGATEQERPTDATAGVGGVDTGRGRRARRQRW